MAMVNHVTRLQMAHSGRVTQTMPMLGLPYKFRDLGTRVRLISFGHIIKMRPSKRRCSRNFELWADILYEISPKLANKCRQYR